MLKPLIRVCCACLKSEHKGRWGHHEKHEEELKAEVKDATHTYCPPCYAVLMKEVKHRYE